MKQILMCIFLSVLVLPFFKVNAQQKNIEKASFRSNIRSDIQKTIPENIDFIAYCNGRLFPSKAIAGMVQRNFGDYPHFKSAIPEILRNKCYIFASVEGKFCGLLVESKSGDAKKIFQRHFIQLKKEIKDLEEKKEQEQTYLISGKEKLLFFLINKNLLLLSVGEIDISKFKNNKRSPMLSNIDTGNIISAYFNRNILNDPMADRYLKYCPELKKIEYGKISYAFLSPSIDADLKFQDSESAVEFFNQLNTLLKLTDIKFPGFSSSFSRVLQINTNTLHFSFYMDFIVTVEKVVKYIRDVKTASESISKLKAIGYLLLVYDNEHDKFPDELDILLQSGKIAPEELLLFSDYKAVPGKKGKKLSSRNSSFAYLGKGFSSDTADSKIPLMFEKPWILPKKANSIRVLLGDFRVITLNIPKVSRMSCRQVLDEIIRKSNGKIKLEHQKILIRNAEAEDSRSY